MVEYFDLENAFDYVSTAPQYERGAILNKKTGDIYYTSELGDSDELPDDIDDNSDYIEIPHKNDFELGSRLALEFISSELSDDYDEVNEYFQNRGAYRRFKDLLDSRGKLEEWYKYESSKQEQALREWCNDKGIEITG